MKILAIYCDSFSYNPRQKSLESAETVVDGLTFDSVQLVCIQVEEHDQEDEKSIEKKLLNFIKWVARNNDCKNIVMHSFAHLSESKAPAEFTKALFDKVDVRLKNVGYQSHQTPFGYFLDLDIKAPGVSMARVFKSF